MKAHLTERKKKRAWPGAVVGETIAAEQNSNARLQNEKILKNDNISASIILRKMIFF